MQSMTIKLEQSRLLQLALFCIVFTYYSLINWQFEGPTVLSDEVAYLTQAAALAGHPVELSTSASWHKGYSFLLSPIFYFIHDPFQSWKVVILLNALCWAGTFAVLYSMLRRIFPDRSPYACALTVGVCALLPGFAVISGFAFPSSIFALFFIISAYFLLSWSESSRNRWSHTLMTSILYWLHPLGLAPTAATTLITGYLAKGQGLGKKWLGHTLMLGSSFAFYNWIFHPFVNNLTAATTIVAPSHYPKISDISELIRSSYHLSTIGIFAAGQIALVLTATFGIASTMLYAGGKALFLVSSKWGRAHLESSPTNILAIYLFLTMTFAIALGSVALVYAEHLRLDHLIYGRYLEPFLPAVLALSICLGWRNEKFSTLAAAFILLHGLGVHAYSTQWPPTSAVNYFNAASYWPIHFLPAASFPVWAGAAGLIVLLTHRLPKFVVFTGITFICIFTLFKQLEAHRTIFNSYSKPDSLVHFVRANIPGGSSIGWEPTHSPRARKEGKALYSYYFFDMDFGSMSFQDWLSHPAPILFTHTPPPPESLDLGSWRVLARGLGTHMFVLAKAELTPSLNLSLLSTIEYFINSGNQSTEVIAGSFDMTPRQLKVFSEVGRISDESIRTDGRPGFLFFGPYIYLPAGSFVLLLDIETSPESNAVLDIVSNLGRTTHAKTTVADADFIDGTLVLPFELSESVAGLEVRLAVSRNSMIKVRSYKVRLQR
ncbi:MAG: phospholipid carrier-dependent glycosyltransferase [Puniceicoccaceae bacterium]|nr:MAG: phospholipid carrier-dependent glycosyltransferase [Puniceicoccaceae bacterium]